MEGRRELVKAKNLAENKRARLKSARLSPLDFRVSPSHKGRCFIRVLAKGGPQREFDHFFSLLITFRVN